MSVLSIWTWSSLVSEADAVREAVDVLVAHCCDEHPLIKRLEWVSAISEDGDRVDFQWLEGYGSQEAMNNDHYTDECKALWEPVRRHAIEGTFTGRAWNEGGGFAPR